MSARPAHFRRQRKPGQRHQQYVVKRYNNIVDLRSEDAILVLSAPRLVVAPVSWRVLFPNGLDLRHGGVRLILYGAIGAGVVLTVGVVVPRVFGIGRTLLTAPSSVTVCLALFLVGGWGLGARHLARAASLERSEARASTLAREAERAQLLALRSHLDPHFLFNTLNAIAEWCREDGEVAERAVLQLSAMLRTVLEGVHAPTLVAARGAGVWSRRCSRCTACAIPTASASCSACPSRSPRWPFRRCCFSRWPRTP